MFGCLAERSTLGGHQNPHELQPKSLQRGVCSPRQGTGDRPKATYNTREGRNLKWFQAAIERMDQRNLAPVRFMRSIIQPGRHIVTLRRARPNIVIEVQWCPALQSVPKTRRLTSGQADI